MNLHSFSYSFKVEKGFPHFFVFLIAKLPQSKLRRTTSEEITPDMKKMYLNITFSTVVR